jgi:type VI secretion system protein ImpE
MDWLNGRSLSEALQDVQQQVKKAPAQPRHRIYLFQLLAVLGQWERALNQLNVLSEMDVALLPMVHTYRHALQSEALRGEVFEGRRSPLIFGEPERWIALLLEALRLGTQGAPEKAKALRAEAFDLAPASPGRVSDPAGESFAWIADADERLGPMLEALIDGKYYWAPFSRIASLHLGPPEDLRDLVWIPAVFEWRNGGQSSGFVPTRYPGSEKSGDERIQKAALTRWVDFDDGSVCEGQRLLITDVGDYALMDVRALTLDGPEAEPGAAPAKGG